MTFENDKSQAENAEMSETELQKRQRKTEAHQTTMMYNVVRISGYLCLFCILLQIPIAVDWVSQGTTGDILLPVLLTNTLLLVVFVVLFIMGRKMKKKLKTLSEA